MIPVIGCETIPVGRYVSDDNGTYTLLAIGSLRKNRGREKDQNIFK